MGKTYQEFTEASVTSWDKMKDQRVIKSAEKFKKKMKSGNILGYTTAHGEFTIFRNEKDWKDAVKHGKDMKWIKVD